jgi:hypothetical protein
MTHVPMHRLIPETVTDNRGMGVEERNHQRITPIRGRRIPRQRELPWETRTYQSDAVT